MLGRYFLPHLVGYSVACVCVAVCVQYDVEVASRNSLMRNQHQCHSVALLPHLLSNTASLTGTGCMDLTLQADILANLFCYAHDMVLLA